MNKAALCLWYAGGAGDAAQFYAQTFPDSAISAIHHAPGDYPGGKMGDVLMVLTCTGDEKVLQQAVQAAHERDMTVMALTGKGGGALAKLLRETDVHVCVPHERAARVREVHQLVLHCLCDGVDAQLLGEQELSE